MTGLKILDFDFSMSTGAPAPLIISSEGSLCLIFYCQKYRGVDISFPIERNVHEDKKVAIFKFGSPLRTYFGDPSEHEIGRHRYYNLGVKPYAMHELQNSDWMQELDKGDGLYLIPVEPMKHFLFTFHDSCFECVFRGYEMFVENITMEEAVSKYATSVL